MKLGIGCPPQDPRHVRFSCRLYGERYIWDEPNRSRRTKLFREIAPRESGGRQKSSGGLVFIFIFLRKILN